MASHRQDNWIHKMRQRQSVSRRYGSQNVIEQQSIEIKLNPIELVGQHCVQRAYKNKKTIPLPLFLSHFPHNVYRCCSSWSPWTYRQKYVEMFFFIGLSVCCAFFFKCIRISLYICICAPKHLSKYCQTYLFFLSTGLLRAHPDTSPSMAFMLLTVHTTLSGLCWFM